MRMSLLVLAGLVPAVAAQTELGLTPCTTGIGGKIDYELSGGSPFRPFFFFTSLQRGSFPLAAIDPRDKRSLGVGFDLLPLLLLGRFDARGRSAFALQIPNDSQLAGKALLHQALAFPGAASLFGPMSQVKSVPLEPRAVWRRYPIKTMQDRRAWLGVIPLRDERYLMCGGGTGALLALQAWPSTEIWDAATGLFSAGPKMTQARALHVTGRRPDGRWILCAGVDDQNNVLDTSDIYDPASNTFTKGPKLGKTRFLHTGTTLPDGRLWIVGGLEKMSGNALTAVTSATRTTEFYDPKTNSFSAGPNLSEPKAGQVMLTLPDGRIVITGGISWYTFIIKLPRFSSRVEIYDPKTNKLSRLANMRTARAGHAATLLPDGRLVVAGGASGNVAAGGAPTSKAEVYDFQTNRWTAIAALRTAKALMGQAWMRNGKFAVLGGAKGSLTAPQGLSECEALDPKTLTWSLMPSMNASRATHATIVLPSCAIAVIAGGGGQTGTSLKDSELYIPR